MTQERVDTVGKDKKRKRTTSIGKPEAEPKDKKPKLEDNRTVSSQSVSTLPLDLDTSDTISHPTLDEVGQTSSLTDGLLEEPEWVSPTHWDKSRVPEDINNAFKDNPELMPQDFSHYKFEFTEGGLDVKRPKGSESPLLHLEDYGSDICGFNLTSEHDVPTDDKEKPKKKRLNDYSVTQTRPKGSTFGGERKYPMDEYTGEYQRSHGIDHADGNNASTTSEHNFTPHLKNYNEGLRNHVVRNMRDQEGGIYSEQNHYGSSTMTMADGKLVPEETSFTVAPRSTKKNTSKHKKKRQWRVPQQGKKTLVGTKINDALPFLKLEGDSKVAEGTHKYETKEEQDTWMPDSEDSFSEDEWDY